MSRWFYFFVTFIIIETCALSQKEEICIDYYKTGEEFDLTRLIGDWYAVFHWPPLRRQKDRCEVIKFSASSGTGCVRGVPPGTAFIQSTYRNSADKLQDVYYYGTGEVKKQIRNCDRFSNYIFVHLSSGYVLGINCSSDGRGVLLAKSLPTGDELAQVLEDTVLMIGRSGGPDCELEN